MCIRDSVYIDESVIATRARVTPHEVYESLVGLSRYRIVNYIPHKKTPLIIYTQTREEQRYLSIPRSAYEERKERFGKRIEKVLEYINEERVCRSRMLLSLSLIHISTTRIYRINLRLPF